MPKFEQPIPKSSTESKAREKFNVSEALPGKVIREKRVRAHTPEDVQEVRELIEKGFRVFENLRDNYQITLPHFESAIGDKDQTGYATFTLTVDLIEGSNVEEMTNLFEVKEKLERLYCSLIKHYRDTYQQGGDYWSDFRNDQFVYGHNQSSGVNDLYLVDLDATNVYIGTYNLKNKHNLKLFEQLFALAFAIKQAEGKMNPPAKLEEARRQLLDFIKEIPGTEKDYEILVSARKLIGEEGV